MTLSGDDCPRDRDFGYASTTCRDVPAALLIGVEDPDDKGGKMALGNDLCAVWVSFLLANNGS